MKLQNFTLVDLTHTLDKDIPTWEGECGFKTHITMDYEQGARVVNYEMVAGIGTHMDAPSHFFEGCLDICDIEMYNLVIPVCVLHVSDKIQGNDDYFVSVEDVEAFEKQYGKIPTKSFIAINTGWWKKWDDADAYRNVDSDGRMHFPGISLQAVEFLLERDIVGIGIDTLSPDGSNLKFPVHKKILGVKKYIVENLTNLDSLPAIGAYIFVLPLKIKSGTESPVRVIGLIS